MLNQVIKYFELKKLYNKSLSWSSIREIGSLFPRTATAFIKYKKEFLDCNFEFKYTDEVHFALYTAYLEYVRISRIVDFNPDRMTKKVSFDPGALMNEHAIAEENLEKAMNACIPEQF